MFSVQIIVLDPKGPLRIAHIIERSKAYDC